MARETPVNTGYEIINGNATGYNAAIVDVWLEWKQLSTDVDKNQSEVRVLLYAQCTGSSSTSWSVAENFGYVSCDGNEQYRSTTYNFANKEVNCFGYYTFTVLHDTDGSKTVTLEGSFKTNSAYIAGGSVSDKVTLDTIPRASVFGTITGATLGETMRVNISRASTAYSHKVFYHWGNNVWSHGDSGDTYADIELPIKLAELSPNSKEFELLLLLRTYNGTSYDSESQVGEDVRMYVTVTIPENDATKPTVTMVLKPEQSIDGLYIQNISKVHASITASGQYGAQIDSRTMHVQQNSYPVSTEGKSLSGTLTEVGNITVTCSAVDSRGITGTAEQTISVLPYYKPRLVGVKAYRCNSAGEAKNDGEYLKIEATRDYAKVITKDESTEAETQHNFCSIKYRYRQENAAFNKWSEIMTENAEGDTVETAALLEGALNKEYGYVVQIVATDTVGQQTVVTIQIPCERVFRHKRPGGKGLGLGGYASDDDLLDVYWNARLRKKLTVDENVYAQSMNNVCIRQWEILGGDSLLLTAQPGERGQGSVLIFGGFDNQPVSGFLFLPTDGLPQWQGTENVSVTPAEENQVNITFPQVGYGQLVLIAPHPLTVE